MRTRSCSVIRVGVVVLWATAGAGCHLFDPKLYEEPPDSGRTGTDAGVGGGGSDLPLPFDGGLPPDAASVAGPLCGRSSPASLCPSNYLFCDGFEDESGQSFSRWSSSFVDNLSGGAANFGTSLVIDNGSVCLGQHALHAATSGTNQEAVVIRTLANLPNPVHVRFFMFIKQHATSSGLVEFRNSPGDYASLFLDPPKLTSTTSRFGYQTNLSSGLPTIGPELALDHNRWLCLELTMRFDTNSGEVHLQLDGNPVGDLVGVQTQSRSGSMDRMALGPISDDSGNPLFPNEIYFDEVAVSADPIGCM
jgi:hypothetical protein